MWYLIPIGALLVLYCVLQIIAAKGVNGACARGPSGVLISDEDVVSMARYAYRDELEAGANWLSTQPMEHIRITSRDGLQLHARMLHANHPKGVILAFHGYHSFAEKDFGCIAPYLTEAGYSILFVDQRAHEESEGKTVTYGVRERFDCLEWAETIEARTSGMLPIYLYGQSMGAATIMMASGLVLPDSIKGIVADCGFTSPAAQFQFTLKHKYGLPAFPLLPLMALYARLCKGFSIHGASTTDALSRNNLPVLFYHGKLDQIVPYSMGMDNDRAAVSEHMFCSMDGAAHCTCFFHDKEQYIGVMLSFLNEHR